MIPFCIAITAVASLVIWGLYSTFGFAWGTTIVVAVMVLALGLAGSEGAEQ